MIIIIVYTTACQGLRGVEITQTVGWVVGRGVFFADQIPVSELNNQPTCSTIRKGKGVPMRHWVCEGSVKEELIPVAVSAPEGSRVSGNPW